LLLPFGQPGLAPIGFLAALADVLLRLPPHGGDLLLDLHQGLADGLLGFPLGIRDQAPGPGLRRPDTLVRQSLPRQEPDARAEQERRDRGDHDVHRSS
jgi:hypothetical protein